MNTLVLELGTWIGLAAGLGVVAGLCVGLVLPRRARTESRAAAEANASAIADAEAIAARQQAELDTLHARLDQAQQEEREKDEVLRRLGEELDTLRAEHRAATQHRADLERVQTLAHSLQARLDESSERVAQLERELQRPTPTPAAAPDPTTSRPLAPLFDTLNTIDLDVQKSQPLRVSRRLSGSVTSVATIEPPVQTPQERDAAGAERDISELPGMPPSVRERLTLIGAGTNLSFLRKAGRKSGRGALMASTRLDETTLLGWLRLADLMRVGMRTEDLRALWQTGIRSLEELGQADAAKLAARAQAKSEQRGGDAIDVRTVQRWIDRARTLDSLVTP